MLFSADERSHDPVVLAVAVARLDDVAEDEWVKNKSRKKAEHLAEQFERARVLIRSQLRQELEQLWESGDERVRNAQRAVIQQLCEDLSVFPVSAPQYRRLLACEPDDPPFIADVEQSGVPEMQRRLTEVVSARRADARLRRDESMEVWLKQVSTSIELVRSMWKGNQHTEQEVQELQRELKWCWDLSRRSSWFARDNFVSFLRRLCLRILGRW